MRTQGLVERLQLAKAAPGADVRGAPVTDALRISLQRIRPMAPDIAWAVFVGVNLLGMRLLGAWPTVPFLVIWVSLTMVYGFRMWRLQPAILTVAAVTLATGGIIVVQVVNGQQEADYLVEVPLVALMFLVMVWHGRRRQAALLSGSPRWRKCSGSPGRTCACWSSSSCSCVDASHELGTPITVALGHAELIEQAATDKTVAEDARVVIGELARLRRLSSRHAAARLGRQPRLPVTWRRSGSIRS